MQKHSRGLGHVKRVCKNDVPWELIENANEPLFEEDAPGAEDAEVNGDDPSPLEKKSKSGVVGELKHQYGDLANMKNFSTKMINFTNMININTNMMDSTNLINSSRKMLDLINSLNVMNLIKWLKVL